MISFAGASRTYTEDNLLERGFNDTGKAITTYFNSTRIRGSRINHFVLIPTPLTMIAHGGGPKCPLTLDFDSDQLVGFSKSTINMLRNAKEKVYPLPLVIDINYKTTEAGTDTVKPLDDAYQFKQCSPYIRAEKQFIPTFDVVGHGTPKGIGPLDPKAQISPEEFAENIAHLFTHNKLTHLKESPLKFFFHTCNSAYVEVTKSMEKDEILQKIFFESFIGRFYQAMCAMGYTQLSVTGYRGYYIAVSSKGAGSARLQDSFFAPQQDHDLKHGEYTIDKGICKTLASIEKMSFNVELMSTDALPEVLAQKLSVLKM